ncbi:MAG: RHS repeat-associated core domain-containing protein, partial [Actinomycetota bacterium]|nr:RHS repeat-associated core domain-containing protein [Actinomycetota bacterium]
AADNLTKINGVNSATQVYDAANQLQTATTMNGPTQIQKYTYGYDANGNRTSRTDQNNALTNYGWDQADRLTRYGSTASYAYNGDELRVSKTVSATTTQFVWDVADGLPLLLSDGNTSYVYGPDGPLEQVTGTTPLWMHSDELGSTRALTDSVGTIQATYSYDAYGNLLTNTGTANTALRFAGEYEDAESGQYYLRARYYDPQQGQFISRDPLLPITREAYSYVSGNPLNAVDPSGRFAQVLVFEAAVLVLATLAVTAIVLENTGHQAPDYGGAARTAREGWDTVLSTAEGQAAAAASIVGTGCVNAWNTIFSFAKRQQPPALDAAEKKALDNKEAGLPFVLGDYKSAIRKLTEGEKYLRDRNKGKAR